MILYLGDFKLDLILVDGCFMDLVCYMMVVRCNMFGIVVAIETIDEIVW